MSPSAIQPLISVVVIIVVMLLVGRRMLRPRRFRLGSLWIGPAFTLFGIISYMAEQPPPTPAHGMGLALALIFGGAIGWVRAKLVRITFDHATGSAIQQGTPYGILLIVGLVVVRSGISFIAFNHPELGIDLKSATDILLLFAFGLLTGYATELWRVVGRVRRIPPRLA